MQSLGVLGIFKESYKIITSQNLNLYSIVFLFIFPTYFISLINNLVSNQLLTQTGLNTITTTTTTTTTFNQTQQQNGGASTFASYNPYSHLFSPEFAPFWLLQLICFIPTLIFKLIYTSAGIYTVACIQTGQDVSFIKVMAIVSKVWKRLLFTFFCTFIAFIAFTAVAVLILKIPPATIFYTKTIAGIITFFLVIFFVMLTYLVGSVYLMLVSQLADVVSVLEEAGGFKAMKKSNQLLKGNKKVAIIMFFFLLFVYYALQYAFGKLVMYAWSLGMVAGAVSEIISLVLPMVFTLIEIVSQTVLYCVCKSHHHENVDKLTLFDLLDQVNVSGEYAPLKTEELSA